VAGVIGCHRCTGESRIAYGPTSVIAPQGKIVTQVPLLRTGMVIADIR